MFNSQNLSHAYGTTNKMLKIAQGYLNGNAKQEFYSLPMLNNTKVLH